MNKFLKITSATGRMVGLRYSVSQEKLRRQYQVDEMYYNNESEHSFLQDITILTGMYRRRQRGDEL